MARLHRLRRLAGGAKPPAELDIEPGWFEEAGVIWPRFAFGVSGIVAAILISIAALALVAAAIAVGGTATILVAVIAAGIAVGGAIWISFMGGYMIGGSIDPAAIDYQRTVELPPARAIALDPAIPPRLLEVLGHIDLAERLGSAGLDLIEHARAADGAKDETWYRDHMERLYRAQVHQGRHVREAAAALAAWATDEQELLRKAAVAPKQPLRDRFAHLAGMRPTLRRLGFADSDVNHLLLMSRLPGPLLQVFERQTEAMIAQSDGTAAGLLEVATKRLASIETVDKELFGIKE